MGSVTEDILIQKLNEILSLLSEFDSRTLFDNFKKWQSMRKSSIGALEELEKDIIDVKNKTDIARGIGIGVSLLGGLSALIGIGLSFNDSTKNTGDSMIKGGITAGAIGGATSFAAAGTNCFISHRKIENAKEILEKDRRSTDNFLPFLRKAKELDELFMDIFGCSIASTTLKDIFKVFEEIQIISNEVGKDILEIFSEIFPDSLMGSVQSVAIDREYIGRILISITPKIKQVLQKFRNNPQTIKSLIKIQEIVKRTPLALEIPKFFLSLKDCLPHIKNIQLLSSLHSLVKSYFYTLTCNSTFVVFTLIKVGIDVVALLSLKDDFRENGTEYSEMLKGAIALLKTELSYVTKKYESLNRQA